MALRALSSTVAVGSILGRWRTIYAIAIRNRQRDIRHLRLIDLRNFGRTSVCESPWKATNGG